MRMRGLGAKPVLSGCDRLRTARYGCPPQIRPKVSDRRAKGFGAPDGQTEAIDEPTWSTRSLHSRCSHQRC